MSEQTWIGFIGSANNVTPKMQEYTVKAVERAIEKGWRVIVGDNPNGIDLLVYKTCKEHNHPVAVVCLRDEFARSIQAVRTGKVPQSTGKYEAYHQRDLGIIWGADILMCIWNGQSRATKEAFEAAREQGVHAFLADFTNEKVALTEVNKP